MSSKVPRIPEAWTSPDARCFHGSSHATSWISVHGDTSGDCAGWSLLGEGREDMHTHTHTCARGADSGKEWKGKERNGKVRKGKNKLGAVGVGQDGLHSRHWLRRGRRRPIGKRRLRPHLPLSSSVPQISSRSACVYTGTGNDTFEKSRLTCVPGVGGQTPGARSRRYIPDGQAHTQAHCSPPWW